MNFVTLGKKIMIVTLVTILPILGKAQQTPLQLTLERAVQIALSENPNVRIADLEIQKKEYAKKTTKSSLYPQIDAVGQYTRTIKKQVMYLDGAFDMTSSMKPMLDGINDVFADNIPGYNKNELYDAITAEQAKVPPVDPDEGIEVGRSNNWSGGFNLNWPVVVPTLWKSLEISSLDVELAVESARSSKINMSNDVKKTYYQVLLAQDSRNVFKQSYDNAVLNYNDIKHKYDQGLVAEFDLIRADVRVKNVKPNLIQAENAVNLTTLSLKALMGIDMDQEIIVEGNLKDYEQNLYSDIIAADTSLANNSDLKQFDIQAEQLQKTLELYKAQYWPTVSISGNYMYMSMNNDFRFKDYKWSPYSTVGLTVSIPIFDGFRKRSDIKQTQVSLEQMKLKREDIVRNLTLSVKNSVSSMTNYVEQVFSTRDAVKQAQKGYEISQKRYDTGMGTLLELNDAELALTQTSLSYNQAIYYYLSAKADLAKTLGLQ